MIATKTLAAIEAALVADQGAKFRSLLKVNMPLQDDAYRPTEERFRTHLGASLLGRECSREIWYGFRWYTEKRFEGRMIRLFNRGHLEEPRMVSLLQMIGVSVFQFDERGKQFRIGKGHKGHGGGGMDGVALGVPDFPTEYMLTEYKTHGEKSFLKLKDDGLLKTKWEHFVQCQIYMGDQNLTKALYVATNKNTDEIHAEIVQADGSQYKRYMMRQQQIIDADKPPPRIAGAKDETFFKCKFCDHAGVCWEGKAPVRTCRSCRHAVIMPDSAWSCAKHHEIRTAAEQEAACPQYEVI